MTAEERDQVRALVERTCAAQGVPLKVPPDVARAVATMIAGRPRGQYAPLAAAEVGAGAGAGADRAPRAS